MATVSMRLHMPAMASATPAEPGRSYALQTVQRRLLESGACAGLWHQASLPGSPQQLFSHPAVW